MSSHNKSRYTIDANIFSILGISNMWGENNLVYCQRFHQCRILFIQIIGVDFSNSTFFGTSVDMRRGYFHGQLCLSAKFKLSFSKSLALLLHQIQFLCLNGPAILAAYWFLSLMIFQIVGKMT